MTQLASTRGAGNTAADLRLGRRLEVFGLAWNVVEAVVSIGAGILAGSTALVGFGVDSAIESVSGSVLLWRLQDREAHEERERTALRLVGISFVLLALWIAWDAIVTLVRHEPPDASPVGIGIAVASLFVMPWLAWRKRQVAARLASRALEADSRQTSICAYLSAILLGGLVLNATLGWWWADPVAALCMIPILGREAAEALRGERCEDCCDCSPPRDAGSDPM